ncbi:MAG: hypothetical protein ACFCU1_04225 [Sumerlaeia bacterium]
MKESKWELNLQKLFQVNLVFLLIGMLSGIYLINLNVEGAWYGLPVYILFLARFLRPAVVVHLTVTILKTTKAKIIILFMTLSFLLYAILIGRRSEFGFLFLYTVATFHFLKGWNVPRSALPVGLVLSLIIINVIPTIRDDFREGDYSGFFTVNYNEVLNNYFSGDKRNEIIESAYTLAAYERSGEAAWGAGIWNQLVNQYVPRGILGAEFKDALRLYSPDPSEIRKQYSDNTEFYYYLSPVGYTSAFMEFRYFAFLFFLFFGMLSKLLYELAIKTNNLFWMMVYTIFSISIPLSNSLYIGELFSLNIVYMFVLLTSSFFAYQRKKPKVGYIIVPTDVKNALIAQRQQQLYGSNKVGH